MSAEIEKRLGELGINIATKRHSFSGRWDMRAYHPWGTACLCSVSSDIGVDDAWKQLCERLPKILDHEEKFLRELNTRRTKKFERDAKQERRNMWDDWY